MKSLRRIATLVLAGVLCFALVACGGGGQEKPINDKVIVIAVDASFEEKWNPFIVESAYDHEVVDQVFSAICALDANNELMPNAGDISAVQNSDGTVLYTIKIQEGMKFSDGEPVTIDDYIYGLYVRSDPSYAGRPGSTLGGFIEGVPEYFYDNPSYSDDIAEIEATAEARYDAASITWEDFLAYAKDTNLAGWWNGTLPGDIGDGTTWEQYIKDEGFEDLLANISVTDPAQMLEAVTKVEYENYRASYDAVTWAADKAKAAYALDNLEGGTDVATISGINKIDELTCTVKYTVVSITGDRELSLPNGSGNLVPEHYYGSVKKGNVADIIGNLKPMGSGPYKFQSFSDNIATSFANESYFKGEPKIGTVRWQYIPQAEIVPSLASGAISIANPSSSLANVEELTRLNQRFDLIDNAGYGYMGMNTERVPLNVRKGFWSLMNRGPAVEGYYGNLAQVIERPMTTILAEYPDDATPYYPYSRDEALKYFQAAGYAQNGSGQLVDASGKQLVLNVYIGGEGKGEHPAYPMVVQAAEDMAALGAELQIQDVQFAILQGAMNDGSADAWIMAWGSVFDCDKSSQFHSTGGQNRYNFKNEQMDNMLDTIVQTLDFEERRVLVAEMLDFAMDNALELPLYQRKNMLAYNTTIVDLTTIPTATASYDYKTELYKVDVLPAEDGN